MRIAPTILFLTSLLLPGACGHGGGGGTPGAGGGDGAASVTPPTPNGAGAAGMMEGRWVVVSAELVPDIHNLDADVAGASIGVDSEFQFQNGQLLTVDGEDAGSPPAAQGYPANDFLTNTTAGNVTIFLVGATFPPQFLGGGKLRMGIVFGTTSPTQAVAESIETYEFANPAIKRWGHYRAVLERR